MDAFMGDTSRIEYDSARHSLTIAAEFRELLRYRDFLRVLIAKTIKSRYKRSVLGVAWTLLNPLVNMAVLAIAFTAVFRTSIPNYPVYVLIGITVWNFFSQTTTYAMGQFLWGGGLMKRVYVPPSVFAVAAIGNGLVNVAFSVIPLVLIMLFTRHTIYPTWWFFPFAFLLLSVFALGVSLFMSALVVFFADVFDMYQLLLQAWFFLTPIIYPTEMFPAKHAWILELNPMHHFVELVRAPLFTGHLPDLRTCALAASWALASLVLGAWTFTRKADEFAYR
jgi:ABC-type polysaccharide/polyol phosphate export permease